MIEALLDEALSAKTTAEWLALFGGRVPAAPVLDVGQALENPFLAERQSVQDFSHPQAGPFRLLASPIRVPGVEPPSRPAPALGADTDLVLDEIGFGSDERARLRDAGIV